MEVNQYLEMFIEESKEHLQACSEHLLELEKNPEDLAIVGEIFRSAHTLKGMAATMGFEDLADLTHKMENILDAILNEKIKVTAEIFDVIFESVEHLEEMVYDIADGGDGKRDVQETVEKLKRIESWGYMKKFRGKRRYFRNLLRETTLEHNHLDFGQQAWFDLWHTHLDFWGLGNTSLKVRRAHIKAHLTLYENLIDKLQQLNQPYQTWIEISELEAYRRNRNECERLQKSSIYSEFCP